MIGIPTPYRLPSLSNRDTCTGLAGGAAGFVVLGADGLVAEVVPVAGAGVAGGRF
jgi:hypothetical protein